MSLRFRGQSGNWQFERVAGPFGFTEGPVWDGEAIRFTDIPGNRIMRYVPATGESRELHTNTERMNGLALDREGRIYGCQGGGRSGARPRVGLSARSGAGWLVLDHTSELRYYASQRAGRRFRAIWCDT
jgi:sugar lactone lactonase YvrE